jgi:drug/metabolite transporter (DMT)-like permease
VEQPLAVVMHSTDPAPTPINRPRATAGGLGAILLWGALALLTTLAGPVPPFQMVAITFTLGAVAGFAVILGRGRKLATALRWPWPVWLLGVGGLFGFHALYFAALRLAPPAEANLVNYLWPLLIVLLAAPLAGERLRWWHLGGAALGLAGIGVLALGRGTLAFAGDHVLGYACALAWALYSVLSRRVGQVPSEAIAGFCAVTAALALACHLLLEVPRWPQGPVAWAAVVALGLGPTGAAFYLWDHAVKRGDIRVLGALAYLAPLLSTALLLVFGQAAWSPALGAAALLIVGGAVLAARDLRLGATAKPE